MHEEWVWVCVVQAAVATLELALELYGLDWEKVRDPHRQVFVVASLVR